MRLRAGFSDSELVPVLAKPERIPLARPVGPAPQLPSAEQPLRLLEGLKEVLRKGESSSASSQQSLDMVYQLCSDHIEETLCLLTDAIYFVNTARAAPPIIKWVSLAKKCSKHRKAWTSHVPALAWMRYRLKGLRRAWENPDHRNEVVEEASEIETPPQDLAISEDPMLLSLYRSMLKLSQSVLESSYLEEPNLEFWRDQFASLLSEIQKALRTEQARDSTSTKKAWREWVASQITEAAAGSTGGRRTTLPGSLSSTRGGVGQGGHWTLSFPSATDCRSSGRLR